MNAAGTMVLTGAADKDGIPTIPGELFAKFQTSFYANPVDAVVGAPSSNTQRPNEQYGFTF